MPLIADPEYFAETIRLLAEWAGPRSPDLILGAEARGFIFGAPLAYELGAASSRPESPGSCPARRWRRPTRSNTARTASRCTGTPSPQAPR